MNRFRYTKEQLAFLLDGYKKMNGRDLTESFNEKFGLDKSEKTIRSTLKNHKFRCGRKAKNRLARRCRIFTEEEEAFIRKAYKSHNVHEIAGLLNSVFGTSVTSQQVRTYTSHHRISSGRTGRFKKGHRAWNRGTKGVSRASSGSFKKGNVPATVKPLGHERICTRTGYVLIKVAEPDSYTGSPTRYRVKHRVVWEREYGPVPEGMIVTFKDSDRTNCDPDNLMLITLAENLALTRNGYRDVPAELKPSILALSKLQVKAGERAKELQTA